ncbi:hypothetical protein ACF0H5_020040 [Mactra antiquata]
MSAIQDNGLFKWKQRRSTVSPTSDARKGVGSEQTKNGRMIRFLFLATIPSLIVVIQNMINLKQYAQAYNSNEMIQDKVSLSVDIGELIHRLQIERGTTAMYVSTKGDPFILQRLGNVYKATDMVVRKLDSWFGEDIAIYLTSRQSFYAYLKEFRTTLDPKNISLHAAIKYYTDINAKLIEVIGVSVNLQVALSYWTELSAYALLIFGKEQAGIERALGSTYYSRGQLPQEDLLWYNEKTVLGENFLTHCAQYSAFVRQLLKTKFLQTQLAADIKTMRRAITSNVLVTTSIQSGTIWFDNMTEYINILKDIQDSLAHRIIEQAEAENNSLQNALIGAAVQLVIAFITLPIVTILVQNVVIFSTKLNKHTAILKEEKLHTKNLLAELDEERTRTEELLYQLMPKSVAQTLMKTGTSTPESYDAVTVMFTDVVGFTQIASCSSPMQIVQMLNKLYLTIDRQLDHHDVYKVDTIGDAYMIVSGVPDKNGERHVTEIAKLSLHLLKAFESVVIPHRADEKLKLRIGFDTALKIQITQASAELLKHTTNGYITRERGSIDIKGIGLIQTFWLEGFDKSQS